ncbi:MAG: methionyl-tRNA formyltransferase, partial [Candidatus Acidiferrales bacterium]
MRIVFCGTPEFAVPSLRRLAAHAEFSIEAVITQPDRPRGRGQHVSASPVKEAALEARLHVYQPESIKSESSQEFLNRVAPDAVVIIAYGQIIPARLLTIPRLGWINLHASLLPQYRGAAPIHWAIANGETRTGLTTMLIDAGMDTGPTLLQREMEIDPDETSPELYARMSQAGADLLVESLLKFARGEVAPTTQDSAKASYAPILKKEDGRIDFGRPATEIANRLRGFKPWPGAFTTFRRRNLNICSAQPVAHAAAPGELLVTKNLIVGCGRQTTLELLEVQPEGKKRMSAKDFIHGYR